ncbi:septum formation family protein [Agromyces aerolatus]|uniref:septum formation family protein n=1 Tax=Agromyces sp. LY-1074 TaxID=3074080 RepID=UPI0028543BEC|nr:septum formation family protein [Agromyces sp. LY-1074]MDR5701720.1 septum formation family protein [Agromyces sp. LY-1074]
MLAGLYFLGTQLAGGGAAETPVATTPASAEPTPEPAPEPTGPQPAGVHAWDTLFGGECLDGFTSVWAEEFSVVDCAAPHAAQLVYRGVLAEDAAAPFPGEAEIGSRMNLLCTAPGVIEVGAAAGIDDLQVQGSYPVTEEQWADGERTYYCFVNRASGEPLTGSLQGPGPTG